MSDGTIEIIERIDVVCSGSCKVPDAESFRALRDSVRELAAIVNALCDRVPQIERQLYEIDERLAESAGASSELP